MTRENHEMPRSAVPHREGATLPGPAPASKLSAVEWNDAQGVYLRIYYQDPQNVIREQWSDGGSSWQPGPFVLPPA